MKRRTRLGLLLLSVSCFLLPSAVQAVPDICGVYPPEGMKPAFTYEGTYTNYAWGYAIDIPRGYFGGLYQDPTAPQHGIQVILRWKPRSTVYFSGYANSLEDENAERPLDAIGYCIFGFKTVRKYAREVQSFELRRSRLGTHPAFTYVIRYMCPDNSETLLKETVITIPPERGIVYTVTLETTQQNFKRDHAVFEKFVSSWRLAEWK